MKIHILLVLVLLHYSIASIARERCDRYTSSDCFGIDWAAATPQQMERINAKAINRDGTTPLHWAASWSSKTDIARELLNKGASINAKTGTLHGNRDSDLTPLHFAVARKNKSLSMIRLLLENGADVNAQSKTGFTPLHHAARGNNLEVTLLLLSHGADVNAKSSLGYTPLHEAAGNNTMEEMISLLLQNGADVNSRNTNSATPLHLAAGRNVNEKVLKRLLEGGADVNAEGVYGLMHGTPLHMAANSSKNPKVVELLLLFGANVDARDQHHESTPLHIAAQYNQNPDVTEMLLRFGPNLEATNDQGETAYSLGKTNHNLYVSPIYFSLETLNLDDF